MDGSAAALSVRHHHTRERERGEAAWRRLRSSARDRRGVAALRFRVSESRGRGESEPFRVVRPIRRYDLVPHNQRICCSMERVGSDSLDGPNTGMGLRDGTDP